MKLVQDKQRLLLYVTWGLWGLVLLLGYVSVYTHHFSHVNISSIYYRTALNWLHQQALYNGSGRGFLYAPQSAVLYIPFAIMPFIISELMWRLVFVLVFSLGLYKFSELGISASKINYFFIMSLVTIPLAVTTVCKGQMHLMITGLLMLGIIAILNERYWLAAIFFALSLALKPTAIVVYLLGLALFSRLSYKLLFVTLIIILLLFITQHPSYVLQQYYAFLDSLNATDKVGAGSAEWSQLFGAIYFYTKYIFIRYAQHIVRIFFAVFSLFVCYVAKKNLSMEKVLIYMFTIGMAYLMLFNPRTENGDYVMLVPAIGFFMYYAFLEKKWIRMTIYSGIVLLFFSNYYLSFLLTPANNLWLKPTVTLIFYVMILVNCVRESFKTA